MSLEEDGQPFAGYISAGHSLYRFIFFITFRV